MKNILLHIGRHKTGTSSLQRTFVKNRDILRINNILYPETGIRGYGHHNISIELSRRKSNQPFFSVNKVEVLANLKKEIDSSDCDTVLISSEGFQNCAAKTVRKAFDKYNLEIVCYIRNKIDYFMSAYAQKVQATSYAENIGNFFNNHFKLDYIRFINEWDTYFPDHFNIHIYDRDNLEQCDIIADFFTRYIPNTIPIAYFKGDGNPSIGYDLIAVKRAFNILYPELSDDSYIYRIFSIKAAEKRQQRINIPYNVFAALTASSEAENKFLCKRLSGFKGFDYKHEIQKNELDMFYIQNFVEELNSHYSEIDVEMVLDKIQELDT
jgi:hypothetical protein